jgi:TRAP-type mannitol/chloroaromatic compound transport system permease large subunit
MMHIFQAVAPFLLISIAVLIVVFLVPGVANWLPNLI